MLSVNENSLVIVGAGGHAVSCIDAVQCDGRFDIVEFIGTVSEVFKKTICVQPVLGSDKDLGAPGKLISRSAEFGESNLMVTFHPETLSLQSSKAQVETLLKVLESVPDAKPIITYPNGDFGGHTIATIFEEYILRRDGARLYKSLGQLSFLSCLQFVDGVIGNCSSCLLEAPSFGIGIGNVNINCQQSGHPRAQSVIDCATDAQQISDAFRRLYSAQFRATLVNVMNPYGDRGGARGIVVNLSSWNSQSFFRNQFLTCAVH